MSENRSETGVGDARARVLFVANKILPENDYRLVYGSQSAVCDVTFALPRRTRTLAKSRYLHLGFEEGFNRGVLRALFELFVYLRRNRRELAFVHFFTTNPILFGTIISRLAGVDSVVTFTGFGRMMSSAKRAYALIRPIHSFLLRQAFRSARLVLFQNRSDLARLQAAHPAIAGKFHYVGSTTSMAVVSEKDFESDRLTVLLATRLMPEKGVADFIHIARSLDRRQFRFHLAGPASRGHADLYDSVLAAAQEGSIDYSGNLESREMEQALREAHILLFPSRYGEGLSRLMLEAGFACLCPIAYNIPANRDLISAGRGFLVESGDLDRIMQALHLLAADRAGLRANALAYQAFIIEHYGQEQYTRRLDHLFRELLDRMNSSQGFIHDPN